MSDKEKDETEKVAKVLNVPYYFADFTNLDEVRELGKKLHDVYSKIDVLFNNAGGIYKAKREVTTDGYERTFQTCHLAHFLLTNILLDRLIESKAIIINTSSVGAQGLSKLDINDFYKKNISDKGADTAVWLATTTPNKDWKPGEYYYKRKITKTHKLAYDPNIAKSLWEQSEKMTNVKYPILN